MPSMRTRAWPKSISMMPERFVLDFRCEATAVAGIVGEIVTTVGGGAAVTVSVALAEIVGSKLLRAVTVTLSCELVEGAEYKPEAEIVPVAALPPAVPFTSHMTLLSVGPVTDAENCCVAPDASVAVVGEIVTTVGGGVGLTVSVALAEIVGSKLLRAVTVTLSCELVVGAE